MRPGKVPMEIPKRPYLVGRFQCERCGGTGYRLTFEMAGELGDKWGDLTFRRIGYCAYDCDGRSVLRLVEIRWKVPIPLPDDGDGPCLIDGHRFHEHQTNDEPTTKETA